MHLGNYSFLLQDFYVPEYAGNFIMYMLVDNVQFWWDRLCGSICRAVTGSKIRPLLRSQGR